MCVYMMRMFASCELSTNIANSECRHNSRIHQLTIRPCLSPPFSAAFPFSGDKISPLSGLLSGPLQKIKTKVKTKKKGCASVEKWQNTPAQGTGTCANIQSLCDSLALAPLVSFHRFFIYVHIICVVKELQVRARTGTWGKLGCRCFLVPCFDFHEEEEL